MAHSPEDFDPSNPNSRVIEAHTMPSRVTTAAWEKGVDLHHPNVAQQPEKSRSKIVTLLFCIGFSFIILLLFIWAVGASSGRQTAERQLQQLQKDFNAEQAQVQQLRDALTATQSQAGATQQQLSDQLKATQAQAQQVQQQAQEVVTAEEVKTAEAISEKYDTQLQLWHTQICPQCFTVQVRNNCLGDTVTYAVLFLPPDGEADNKWALSGWWTVSSGSTKANNIVSRRGDFYIYAYSPTSGRRWDGSGQDGSVQRAIVSNNFYVRDGEVPLGRDKKDVSLYKIHANNYQTFTSTLTCDPK